MTPGAYARVVLEAGPPRTAGRIVLVNQETEACLGYQRDELLGQPVEVLVPDKLRSTHQGHRAGYQADPHTCPMGSAVELRVRRKDGTDLPVEMSLCPVRSGDEMLVIAIIRDVTAQRELQHLREEFFANASHDLRTPLSAIKTSIGVLLENELPGTPEPLHRLMLNIDRSTDRMDRLVEDLLEHERLQTGHVELQRSNTDLRDVAENAIRTIESLARLRDQVVRVDLPDEPVPALVDGARVERVLVNLLSNAHKYGRVDGFIHIAWNCASRTGKLGSRCTMTGRVFRRLIRSRSSSDSSDWRGKVGRPVLAWVSRSCGDWSNSTVAGSG